MTEINLIFLKCGPNDKYVDGRVNKLSMTLYYLHGRVETGRLPVYASLLFVLQDVIYHFLT